MSGTTAATRASLAHLPLALLAAPMGLGGLGLAWREAGRVLGAPAILGEALCALAVLAWIGLVGLHGWRALRHPVAVLADAMHPVRSAFLAAPTVGLMLVSAAVLPWSAGLAAVLWWVAIPVHLLVAGALLRRVLSGSAPAAMIAPPLLIPLVGNILAPVFGARLGLHDVAWMLFGIGLVLWLVALPLLVNRLVAGPPLLPALRPSLVILLAPPAVGAVALVALTGEVAPAALALYGVAALVAGVMLSFAGEFARLRFSLAWWSFTFPSAAFAIATMDLGMPAALGWLAVLANTALTGLAVAGTLRLAAAGALLRPEH